MSDLELRISRYLDGEMSLEEEAELRLQLEVSAEARALLRELTLLKRAARRIPSLDRPRRSVEAKLFGQLRAEGLHAALNTAPAPAAPYADRAPRRRMPVRGIVTTLALFLIFIVIGDQVRTPESASLDVPIAAVPGDRSAAPLASLQAPESMVLSSVTTDAMTASAAPARELASATARPARRVAELRGTIAALDGTGSRTSENDGMEMMQEKAADQSMVMMTAGVDAADGSGNAAQTDHTVAAFAAPTAPSLPTEALALRNALRSGRGDASAASSPAHESGERRSNVRIHSASSADAGALFAASVRPGVSYIGKGGGMMAQEMSFRFDASLGEHHQVSLIAGRAPTVSETRTDRTRLPDEPQALASTNRNETKLTNGSFTDNQNGPTNSLEALPASVPPGPAFSSSSSLSLRNEVWVGVGYTYSFAPIESVRFGAGAKAGGSPTSWRVGLEVPVRYRVTQSVSVEAVPSATFVSPYDGSSSAYAADEAVEGYAYKGESQRLSFTSVGLEVGLRIEFGR